MDKIKKSVKAKLNELGDSFGSNEDEVMMEDMTDFVLSPYNGYTACGVEPGTSSQASKPAPKKKAKAVGATEDDVMESINAVYFIDGDFDASDHELKKFADDVLYPDDIERERLYLKSQHQVVSKKISELIVEKALSYSTQVSDMDCVRDEILQLRERIRIIRSSLHDSKTKSGIALSIIANDRKKAMLRRLLAELEAIRKLYQHQFRILEAVEDGKYSSAIRMGEEVTLASSDYKQYSCIGDLLAKVAGASNLIEHSLDQSLAKLTVVFDQDKYSYIFNAYRMLNDVKKCSERLIAYFHKSLTDAGKSVVESHCKESPETAGSPNDYFTSLCKKVPSSKVNICVRELCFVFVKILSGYHACLHFHHSNKTSEVASESDEVMFSTLSSSSQSTFDAAVALFNEFLRCQQLSFLQFDDILSIVSTSLKFVELGTKYFNHSGSELLTCLEKQVTDYFVRYHKERTDELYMFLENECFTICPVPINFTVFDLQEFAFLREKQERLALTTDAVKGLTPNSSSINLLPLDYVNPFKLDCGQTSQNEDGSLASTADDSSADEDPDHIPPNVCNSALNLLRFFGRYLRMTSLLPHLSERSVPAILEIFEFFFASFCHMFANDGADTVEKPKRMRDVLDGVHRRLALKAGFGSDGFGEDLLSRFLPNLSPVVDLRFPDQLYGLVERIVALDSMEFVTRQLHVLRPVMESYIPHDEDLLQVLETFYSHTLSFMLDARQLVFDCVASRSLKLSVLIQMASATKWDINELQTQYSSYVDFLIKDMEAFALRLDRVSETVHLSADSRHLMWDRVIHFAFKALVQGYCEGGKCSTEGRALMQIDFQHIVVKLEPLCGMKPLPHIAFVDGYIKAFYLPESGLEQWVSNHTEYSSRQMISLLNVASHVSKKAKNRIISALGD